MAKFRKKPVVIDAWQWAHGKGNSDEVFVGVPDWLKTAQEAQNVRYSYVAGGAALNGRIFVETLEGCMAADLGDWIIRGVKGELYPCKPDIFVATYDPA
jgi:hypothetical protein